MFSFLKKKTKEEIKKQGQDTSITPEEFVDTSDEDQLEDVETELSLHPNWNLPTEQQYVFRFLNNELEALKPNQISLAGVDLRRSDEGFFVTAFVRNSLNKDIQIGDTELLLLNQENQLVARKDFDLKDLGSIPAKSSRPWEFFFPHNTINKQVELEQDNWKLAFNLQSFQKHQLDLEPSWEEALPTEEKQKLAEVLDKLPKLGKTEFNITGLQALLKEDGSLAVTLFLRNGNLKTVSFQNIPLKVEDANKTLIAQGSFALDNLEVKGNSSKPWTFIFPKELVLVQEMDLSRWTVSINS